MGPAYGLGLAGYVGTVFLLSRRWVGFFAFVVLLSAACILLGRWQFHRLSERRADNEIIRTNLSAIPAPVETVLTDSPPDHDTQWRAVYATGAYDPAHTLLVKYIAHDGSPGVDVVVPLRLDGGKAVLVDRGWISGPANGQEMPHPPAPPAGRVRVEGWVQLDSSDRGASTPYHGTVRVIGTQQLKAAFPYPILGGYVSAQHESPSGAHVPIRNSGPDLSDGPHFFYGLQWFFFAALAVTGFFWFAWIEYDERRHPERRRRPQSGRQAPPSTDSMTPVR
jgi:cytochrome oxidase assembly protein ShyY1